MTAAKRPLKPLHQWENVQVREYVFGLPIDGAIRNVYITRYDNHRHLLPGGKWVAHTGEHYALRTGEATFRWAYKNYSWFDTPEEAAAAAFRAKVDHGPAPLNPQETTP